MRRAALTSSSGSLAGRQRIQPWQLVPSWLISLALHLVLVVPLYFVVSDRTPAGTSGDLDALVAGDGAGGPGLEFVEGPAGSGTSGGEVGPRVAASQTTASDNSPPGDLAAAPSAVATGASPTKLSNRPPVPLQLPTIGQGTGMLGPGPPVPVGAGGGGGVGDLLRNGSGSPGGGAAGGGNGGTGLFGGGVGTRFFGVEAKGSRFVYLIDASGSMHEYGALGVAKAELLSSLQQLGTEHQFQVIFYNDAAYPWIREGTKQDIYFASEINKNLAAQWMRGIRSDGGTRHMLAMEAALKLNPDVIFLLTDAKEPTPDPGDIERVKRRCQSRCTIHTIEFGVGEQSVSDNFLKKLARFTDGTSVYRDVTRFR